VKPLTGKGQTRSMHTNTESCRLFCSYRETCYIAIQCGNTNI